MLTILENPFAPSNAAEDQRVGLSLKDKSISKSISKSITQSFSKSLEHASLVGSRRIWERRCQAKLRSARELMPQAQI